MTLVLDSLLVDSVSPQKPSVSGMMGNSNIVALQSNLCHLAEKISTNLFST